MITRAVLRYVRITPRKFRQIIPLVKGKNPEDAISILMSVKKGASKYGIDVISSAINNVKRMQGVEVSDLYISNLIANGGPMLKRFKAASMGRASLIKKRTSHITVELDRVAKSAELPKAHVAKQVQKETAASSAKKETAKEKHPDTKKKSTTKKGKE